MAVGYTLGTHGIRVLSWQHVTTATPKPRAIEAATVMAVVKPDA